jgi:lysophospholipase L1-like esterase
MRQLIPAMVCCFGLGLGAGALKWRGSAEQLHREARMAAILSQASQVPAGDTLLIGDSIAERVRLTKLCGRPAINAGIAWATSKDLLAVAPEIIRAARPSIVVVESGANDHGRYAKERAELNRLATFTVDPPRDTVDGVHPNAKGAKEMIENIDERCAARAALLQASPSRS